MKKSIIQDIFYGERGHNETVKESQGYWKVMEQTVKISEELTEGFTENQKKLFDKLCFAEMGLESEAALTYFIEGFKIGLRIGIECMEE